MKILAVDYGDARTGVSLSDPTGTIASRSVTLAERDPAKLAALIASVVLEEGAERIVLGFPRNMNASEGPRAEKTRAFAAMLEKKTGLQVVLWDERLTTAQAHSILSESGKRTFSHKKNVDAVAASLILQSYLDYSGGR